MNLKHILEGVINSVFVKEEVEKVANFRYDICRVCNKNSKVIKEQKERGETPEPGPYYSELRPDEHCTMCACNIHAKVRSLHTSCPIDKWSAVASKEEAAKIAAIIDEGSSKNLSDDSNKY
jgi:hypothetical protein